MLGDSPSYSFEAIDYAITLVTGGAGSSPPRRLRPGRPRTEPCPRPGAIAAMIGQATGVEPYVVGAPNPLMVRGALRAIGAHADTTVLVGTRMDIDIVAGIEAVLVHPGGWDNGAGNRFPLLPRASSARSPSWCRRSRPRPRSSSQTAGRAGGEREHRAARDAAVHRRAAPSGHPRVARRDQRPALAAVGAAGRRRRVTGRGRARRAGRTPPGQPRPSPPRLGRSRPHRSALATVGRRTGLRSRRSRRARRSVRTTHRAASAATTRSTDLRPEGRDLHAVDPRVGRHRGAGLAQPAHPRRAAHPRRRAGGGGGCPLWRVDRQPGGGRTP